MTRGRRPANRLLLALALTTGLVSGLAPTPAAADELAPDTIRVEGRGWGHGRGLSQWGSLGYAVDHGWTSDQILDHYYSNTSSTALEPQQLTVHVTSNDLQVLLVTSGVPFRAFIF